MNWFTSGGAEYARSRPDYPPEVAAFLASLVTSGTDAGGEATVTIDIGCGSGQFTCRLAEMLPFVVGVDPSRDQLVNAASPAAGARGRVDYVCAEAERLPCADGSAALITAAQSAHWFDLPRFWDEVRRIAVDGAVVALVTYGTLTITPQGAVGDGPSGRAGPEEGSQAADGVATEWAGARGQAIPVPVPEADPVAERFDRFYRDEMAAYWPPERAQIETGYADMGFPFAEIESPRMTITRRWGFEDLLGYVKTWSAVRNLRAQGHEDVLGRFAEELAVLWSPRGATREVEWPVTMRVGRVT